MTPFQLGYRMPAEWAPHEATWLAWPHEESDWPGKFPPIPWLYGEIVRHLARVERVNILVVGQGHEHDVRGILKKCGVDMGAVRLFRHRTNRSWTRDFCPLFVQEAKGEVAITDWIFNGWAKYDNWQLDNAVPGMISEALKMKRFSPPFVLEGGSIDVNGEGKLLTTRECLLSPVQARNPGRTQEEMEAALRDYLGATEVIWLENGIVGDDTHGHVDDLARFVSADTVVTVVEEDKTEENYALLAENLAILKARADLRVVTLPMPAPVYFDGQRLPASYANFYIANKLVLVPTFMDRNDRVALNTIASLFPDREIIGVPATDLVLGLGTLHCMTQQQPAPTA
ncbi:MAG TPA: agmatine deiminase family protein [Bryobacteraceae bacterium]|jgi:agmatine deiminase